MQVTHCECLFKENSLSFSVFIKQSYFGGIMFPYPGEKMQTLEATCTQILAKIRQDVRSRTAALQKAGATPENVELGSGRLVCKVFDKNDPDIESVEWALNSALGKAVSIDNMTSLGVYEFQIDDKTHDDGKRLLLAFSSVVTPDRFDRDMNRLGCVLSGRSQSASR